MITFSKEPSDSGHGGVGGLGWEETGIMIKRFLDH